MKSIYIYMFIEKYDYIYTEDGKLERWYKFSEKYKSQIEMLSVNKLYWRGMGGGFILFVDLSRKVEDEYVYLDQASKLKTHRILRTDYNRLLKKFAKINNQVIDKLRKTGE